MGWVGSVAGENHQELKILGFLENFGVFKLKIEKKVVSSQRNY